MQNGCSKAITCYHCWRASAETTKAMLPALIEVVTNARISLIPDTKAKAIAVPMTVANQFLRSDLLSWIAP
jgi:hypothetical protein